MVRRSAQHANADAMSRLPLPEKSQLTPVPTELVLMLEGMDDAPMTAVHIARGTSHDPVLAKVLRYTLHGWPEQV